MQNHDRLREGSRGNEKERKGGDGMCDYEKAVQAMKWLCENTETHNVDDETSQFTKSKGGMFFVRIESSETVNGTELIEMAKELGWKDE
jgi:hypothetical protein